ncbi:uncharacterized protein LOC125673995 [Ostrea edulis]|uniref:uncharacterized protein LOC125673995 n=1 Tax=Ostrea edulis TaxID=37623 RepID=UPI0024AF4D62|nr:uncharacterized protein LOC125673995 [Ostrea edulis]XP_048766929.2 uncharacterized protein LOC125673995 [Ostrea edulis]XP_056014641.1 uncharacterized protein LOC125673995 [Ostrea edulis]XP_056014642.1 uncharacterized protein LOC125673995 [Ostrea edulis]XP_056014643.1 uncharacterized protein LOC125673995 [Ostrea edulis]
MENVSTNGTTISEEEFRRRISTEIFSRHLIPSLVYVIVLFLIGVPGNCLVCHVYTKKWRRRRKPSTLFVLALSWFDLLNNLVSLPTEIYLLTNYMSFDSPFLCKSSRFVTFFMNAASSVVLVGIAIDRFRGIWCSFKTKPFSVSRAKFIVILSVIVAAVTCWPSVLLYGTHTIQSNQHFLKSCLIDDDFSDSKNNIYPFIYGMYLLGSNVVVDITFIVLYSLIGIRIYRRRQFGSLSPKRSWSTVVTFKRRPSLCSFSSTTNMEEDSIPLNAGKGSKFCARLVRQESFTSNKSYNNLRYKYNMNRSVDSLPAKVNGLKSENSCRTLSRISEMQNMTLDHEYRKRSASLPECNVLHVGLTDGKKSPKSTLLKGKSLSRQASFISSQTLPSDVCRYGRTYHTGRTTFMLFVVTLAYVLTFVPYCVIVVIRYSDDGFYNRQNDLQKNFYQIFLRSYLLSSAINPLIYSFTSQAFRKECAALSKKLFCKLRAMNV